MLASTVYESAPVVDNRSMVSDFDRRIQSPPREAFHTAVSAPFDYSGGINATFASSELASPTTPGLARRVRTRLTRSAAYAATSTPLALLWIVVLSSVLPVIFALVFIGVGLLLLGPALRAVSIGGSIERWLMATILDERIETPIRLQRGRGARGFFLSPLMDSSYWRELAFLFVRMLLAPITLAVLIGSIIVSIAGISSLLWGWVADLWFEEIFIAVLIGISAAIAGPMLLLVLTSAQVSLAHGLLGPDKHTLTTRANTAVRNRDLSVAAAEAERQRIERDLHDGAQARLATVALDLGRAKRRLERQGGDEELGKIIDSAHADAKEAIVELRNLARGIHPAVLTDRGLDPALSEIAARCTVPVHLDVHLLQRPAPHIESAAYFAVCELLTNVTKHSRATQAWVTVRGDDKMLRIDVSDNGLGGAEPALGSGLSGLYDRIASIDGTFSTRSPLAGGTNAQIEIPLQRPVRRDA